MTQIAYCHNLKYATENKIYIVCINQLLNKGSSIKSILQYPLVLGVTIVNCKIKDIRISNTKESLMGMNN